MKKIIILLFISFTMIACSKEKSINGIVRFTGPVEADGCGWTIQVNDASYVPMNLDAEHQIEDLNITFDFRKLNSTATCGLQEGGFEKIKILKIH